MRGPITIQSNSLKQTISIIYYNILLRSCARQMLALLNWREPQTTKETRFKHSASTKQRNQKNVANI